MGGEERLHRRRIAALLFFQDLHELEHAAVVPPRSSHYLRAHPVSITLIVTAELQHVSAGQEPRCDFGCASTTSVSKDGAEKRQQAVGHHRLGELIRRMPPRNVSGFMGEHADELRLVSRCFDRPAVDPDGPSGQGKRVDLFVIRDRIRIWIPRPPGVCGKLPADAADVGEDLRVGDRRGFFSDLRVGLTANLNFLVDRNQRNRRDRRAEGQPAQARAAAEEPPVMKRASQLKPPCVAPARRACLPAGGDATARTPP
jgi:hypothetical protein